MTSPRTVSDGRATYRARIETRTTRRGREQWRYVIERTFVHERVEETSRWSRDEAKVRQQASARLDAFEKVYHDDDAYL